MAVNRVDRRTVSSELVTLPNGRQLLLIPTDTGVYKVVPVFGDFALNHVVLADNNTNETTMLSWFYENAVRLVFRWFAESHLKAGVR